MLRYGTVNASNEAVSRWLKVLVAAYALCFALALIAFVVLLFIVGHFAAEKVWSPVVLVPLFLICLPIAHRYMKE